MNQRGIRCLLSDCDGVIVDSEVAAERAMREELTTVFGAEPIGPLLTQSFGLRVLDIIRLIEDRLGTRLPDDRRVQLQRAIDARVVMEATAMPGVREAYADLSVPIAVVSNSALPRVRDSVAAAGLAELVGRHVYSAEDVGRPKPAPDAYWHAAWQLRAVPGACLVVEDSVTGVQAARAAGMRVLGFLGGSHVDVDHGERLLGAGADGLISAMAQLKSVVEMWSILDEHAWRSAFRVGSV